MNDEKIETTDIVIKKGKFLTWLDNYWYHYKWVTIIVAFFLIVALICTLQVCTKTDYDISVTYAGQVSLKANQKVDFQKALQNSLPEEFSSEDSEQETAVELISYFVLSQEQIEKLEKQTEVDSNGDVSKVYIDRAFVTNEMDSFEAQLTTGSGSVLFVDRWIYDSFLDSDGNCERLMPVSEVLGENAKGTVGAYGIRLGDTELYKNNPQLSFLPEDTVICLHRKIIGQKGYEQEIAAFKAYTVVAE